MYRYPQHQKVYTDTLAKRTSSDCPFCDTTAEVRKVIEESAHALVIQNLFPFDIWDGCTVTDHLLVIPREHADSLQKLSPDARTDMMNLYAKYEAQGYNVYSRAPQSSSRTYPHIHTHLIKITGQPAAAISYTKEPHSLVVTF